MPTMSRSSITTEDRDHPIHPGEHLLEDFMKPLGLSANRLAMDLYVPVTRIHDIVHGRRRITGDTALRLGRYFGTTARIWLDLQSRYDLEVAEDQFAEQVEREVAPRPRTEEPIGV